MNIHLLMEFYLIKNKPKYCIFQMQKAQHLKFLKVLQVLMTEHLAGV
uniref:Uncharacterized protein n=1 Tax=viral metagenome TaxID=1070528 RepID=A0A6C0F524_9ZZZZ